LPGLLCVDCFYRKIPETMPNRVKSCHFLERRSRFNHLSICVYPCKKVLQSHHIIKRK
jgi:hypothetical protein